MDTEVSVAIQLVVSFVVYHLNTCRLKGIMWNIQKIVVINDTGGVK